MIMAKLKKLHPTHLRDSSTTLKSLKISRDNKRDGDKLLPVRINTWKNIEVLFAIT
jgi:hypothetical protein